MKAKPKPNALGIVVKSFPKLSETFILNEVLGLQEAGLKIIVFALQRCTDPVQQPATTKLRCPIVYLPSAPAGQLAETLARHCAKAQVAHLHAHCIDATADIALRAAQRAGISCSVSAHAKDIYLTGPDELTKRLASASFTVTCTEHNREHLQRHAPAASRVHRNHHGVDAEYFSPAETTTTGATLNILAVGRLRAKKGFAYALRALAEVRKRHIDARLTIAGYGPDEAMLRVLSAALELNDFVHFVGKLSHRELRDLYRKHHVFLAPSEITHDGDRDGIPNVVLEAMASGLTVIASNVSGIPEAVEHGRSGLLCAPSDSAAIADALGAVAGNLELRRQLGAAARARVLERFSLQASHDRLCALLQPYLTNERIAVAQQPSVGYVLMGYPRRSEAFISSEILQLERQGIRIDVFAIKAGDAEEPHHSVREIAAPVEYLPRLGSLSGTPFSRWLRESLQCYGAAHRRLARRRPLAYAKVALRALAMCVRYRRKAWHPRKVFIKEFLQAGAIAERLLTKPAIRHLHGHFCHGATTVTWFAAELAGLPFSFTAHAKDLWQHEQNPGDLLARKMRAAEFVVTCTEANRGQLRREACSHTPVATVYHGLDTAFFRRAEPRTPTTPRAAANVAPLILAVGRLVEKKGFAYLVDACARLRDAGLPFRCRIVGEDGPERQVLTTLIEQRQLTRQFELLPPVDHLALRTHYQEAAVFVLPCLVAADGDRDGIPNVLAEAMAMELPVVSTAVSGIPEIVVDDVNGRLVPERNAEALAAAIQGLLTDAIAAGRLAANARTTIESQFNAAHTHQQLRQLFERSLARQTLPLETVGADEAIA